MEQKKENTAVKQWIKAEHSKQEENKEKFLSEKDYKEIYRVKQGDNLLTIDTDVVPKLIKTKFGERYVFRLKNPPEHDLMTTFILKEKIVEALAVQLNSGALTGEIIVSRNGSGIETRYTVTPK